MKQDKFHLNGMFVSQANTLLKTHLQIAKTNISFNLIIRYAQQTQDTIFCGDCAMQF